MRWIEKDTEPHELTEWRVRYHTDINFGYELMRQNAIVTNSVIDSLLKEQGWLCAYTGLQIDESKSHIEHVKPQVHCIPVETVTYTNMVACYPEPNHKPDPPYGAKKKDKWPSPSEQHLFVSPLDLSCEQRFFFSLKGKISNNPGDHAAKTTIEKLGLDHDLLNDLRKGAIQGVLGKDNSLRIADAKRRLKALKTQQRGQKFDPFCFVLVQALEKHIKRLENIVKSKKSRQSKRGHR